LEGGEPGEEAALAGAHGGGDRQFEELVLRPAGSPERLDIGVGQAVRMTGNGIYIVSEFGGQPAVVGGEAAGAVKCGPPQLRSERSLPLQDHGRQLLEARLPVAMAPSAPPRLQGHTA
jgi:hypothetical protein